ncbi:MAG: hypothetical protein IJQ71_03370 [Clostridia bacterium]|nr:hypothetical protein [Clostridia bacterium]
MTDRKIITEQHDIVIDYHGTRQRAEWNIRHGLPARNQIQRLRELKDYILRFEDILDTIPDRRARIILRGRYGAGMSIRDLSFMLDMSCITVKRICAAALAGLG